MNDSSNYVDSEPVSVPRFLYGTAWKEDQTRRLTELALQQGFRGIDTANQRKHYFEAGVGEAIAASIESGLVRRDELFLQTKFTFRGGQDDRLPYNPAAPIATQVEQSFAKSLEHLRTDRIDSYILHGPSTAHGLADDDWQAWRAIESLWQAGRVRMIGVSNVGLDQLELLTQESSCPPHFVQNRCYAVTGWDRDVREFCRQHDIVYQGFSLLTANRRLLETRPWHEIATRYERTPAQIAFRFAIDIGMLPLTGTTDVDHMKTDLEVLDFQLEAEDVLTIERMAG